MTGNRSPNTETVINSFKSKGIFTLEDCLSKGVSKATVARLINDGRIEKLADGVYKHPAYEIGPEEEEFAVACSRLGPDAVIGGLTALFYYRLLDRASSQIWVLVPPRKRCSDSKIVLFRTKESLTIGVDVHANFKISILERSLADAFRYASKIGLQIAIRATRQAVRDNRTTPHKVLKIAKELGIGQYVMRHWEAIESEHE